MGAIVAWLARLLPWLQGIGSALLGWFAAKAADAGAAVAVRTAVLAAWGVFLNVFIYQASNLGLAAVISDNPFPPLLTGGIALAEAFFPLRFMMVLVVSYIVFKMTVFTAAVTMSRTIKFLFGG